MVKGELQSLPKNELTFPKSPTCREEAGPPAAP